MPITIRIPTALNSSPPIPEITLDAIANEGGYARTETNRISLGDFSQYGTANIQGSFTPPRFTWSIAAYLTEEEAIQLDALATWQDSEYKAKNEGYLELVDRVELLPAEPSPHPRNLVAALTPPWNAAYEYGYGIFKVVLTLPENHLQHVGRFTTDNSEAKLFQFGAVEI